MTASIIPNNHSNVIYIQETLHFPNLSFPEHLLQLPFAKVAIQFPWESVFGSYESEFLQARLELHRKDPEENEANDPTLFQLDDPVEEINQKPDLQKGVKDLNSFPY